MTVCILLNLIYGSQTWSSTKVKRALSILESDFQLTPKTQYYGPKQKKLFFQFGHDYFMPIELWAGTTTKTIDK